MVGSKNVSGSQVRTKETQECQPCPHLCWVLGRHSSSCNVRGASRKYLRKRKGLSCTCVSKSLLTEGVLLGNSAKAHRQPLAPSAISDSSSYNRKHISDLAFTSRDSASLWCTLWSKQPLCYASCLLSWQLGSPRLHILQLLLWVGLGFTWTVSCRPVPPNTFGGKCFIQASLLFTLLMNQARPPTLNPAAGKTHCLLQWWRWLCSECRSYIARLLAA